MGNKLTILSGLPSSGKSTKAKEIISKNNDTIRVNRDLLRQMLYFVEKGDHSEMSNSREKFVKNLEVEIVKFALKKHKNVVIDDTNFAESTREMWKDIAVENKTKVEIIEIDTPVEECIRRDKERPDPVGEAVIRKFAGLYKNNKKPEKIEKISFPGEKKIIICDIDGTVADCEHRRHFLTDGPKKDWDGFFDAMKDDTIREGVLQLLTLTYKDHPVVMVSGRPDNYRDITENWLKDNNVPYRYLLMRRAGDFRPDTIVKEEILMKYFNKDDIEMIIDDRPSVISMWRRNGLPVIDVGTGEEF
jgi:predicted kinase